MAATNRIVAAVHELTCRASSRDPFKICEELDIRIRYHELGSIKAYYFCQSRIKNIVINSSADDNLKKVLCAHELGHAVLHDRLVSHHAFHETSLFDSTTPTEYEANLFAAELLIGDEDIIENKNSSFFHIASRLFVPKELVDFKCRIMKSRGYDINAPELSDSRFLKDDIQKTKMKISDTKNAGSYD